MKDYYEVKKVKGRYYLFDDVTMPYKRVVSEASSYVKNMGINTQQNVLYSIKHLYDFLDEIGVRHPSWMLQQHISMFVNWLFTAKEHRDDFDRISGRETDDGSVGAHYSNVKNFFKRQFSEQNLIWEDEKVRLDNNGIPRKIVKNRHAPKSKDVLPGTMWILKENFKRIMSYATNSRNALIWKFIYLTGIRIGELPNINKDQFTDYDKNEEYLKIYIHDSFSPDPRKQTKTGGRFIDVSLKLVKETERYILYERKINPRNKHNEIFTVLEDKKRNGKVILKMGDPLSYKAIYESIKIAAERAGIKEATLHRLRHSYAMNMVSQDVNVKEVQEQLGHKNLSSTSRYTKGLSLVSVKRCEADKEIEDKFEAEDEE